MPNSFSIATTSPFADRPGTLRRSGPRRGRRRPEGSGHPVTVSVIGGESETGRLEAFSDGVFAIAITLLILEVGGHVGVGEGTLAHQLGEDWPGYASFLISFAVIGTMWINHHEMFREIRLSDHRLIVTNMLLLLVVTVIPFPTKVVGETLVHSDFGDQRTAVVLYGVTFIAASIAFPLLWRAASGSGRLLRPEVTPAAVRARMRRNLIGLPSFTVATLLAVWSPRASLAVMAVVTALYLAPSAWLDPVLGREETG